MTCFLTSLPLLKKNITLNRPGVLLDTNKLKADFYKRGYGSIQGAVDEGTLRSLRDKLRNIIEGRGPAGENDNGYYSDLQNDDISFIRVIFNQPELKIILLDALNDPFYPGQDSTSPNYIFRGIRARGYGTSGLPLHIDSVIPSSSKYPTGIVTSLALEDQNRENGCVIVVPETHRSDRFADRAKTHLAIALEAKAGDLIFWDTRLWHGTSENTSSSLRLALLCTFSRWYFKQPYRHWETLPIEILGQLTEEEKTIFGFDSIPKRQYGSSC